MLVVLGVDGAKKWSSGVQEPETQYWKTFKSWKDDLVKVAGPDCLANLGSDLCPAVLYMLVYASSTISNISRRRGSELTANN